MGYCASVTGSIVFKGERTEELKRQIKQVVLSTKLDAAFYPDGYEDETNGICHLYDFDGNDRYQEDDWLAVFQLFAGKVVDGYLEFTGDDDSHWRFVCNPDTQEWVKEQGTIVYGYEENKAELVDRLMDVFENFLTEELSDRCSSETEYMVAEKYDSQDDKIR